MAFLYLQFEKSAISALRSRSLMRYSVDRSNLTYATRKKMVAGYETLIEEIIERENAEHYYVNFLFNGLPGRESTKIDIMRQEVTRFHCLLKRHVVRKWDKPGWRELVPVLIGAPDYPVVKRTKVDARLHRVNGGLHYNAVVLLPHRFQPPRIPGERQSRIQESLVVHVHQKKAEYLTDRLYRIHVTPVMNGTTMADYTLKAFKNARISPDDILILNR
jgi:hypothetical protein